METVIETANVPGAVTQYQPDILLSGEDTVRNLPNGVSNFGRFVKDDEDAFFVSTCKSLCVVLRRRDRISLPGLLMGIQVIASRGPSEPELVR